MRSISFGILVSGILLIRKLMWKYISRKTQYALWIFPAMFLLLSPFLSISSKLSLENIVYVFEERAIQDTGENFLQIWNQAENFREDINSNIYSEKVDHNTEMKVGAEGDSAQKDNWFYGIFSDKYDVEEQNNDLGSSFPLAVIIDFFQRYWKNIRQGISAILLLVILMSNFKFGRFCLKNRYFYRKEKELNIYLLEGIASPFLFGKNIYIDRNVIENETVLKHVIMHEYCHYKHKDYFWVILRNLCLIVYWYHPFVWGANEYAKRDCELACDEAVLSGLSMEERKEYGYTLISILKYSRMRKQHAAVASAANYNVKTIKERIAMIKTRKKCNRAVAVISMMCIAILTGCTFTQKTAIEEVDMEKKEAANQEISSSDSEEEIWEQNYNGYYNVSAKAYGKYTYVALNSGLYRISDDSSTCQLLYEGSLTLGTVGEDRLFFYVYPEDKDEAAIMSLDLSTGNITASHSLGEDFYSYMEMYFENGKLYINKQDEIAVFKVLEDGTLQREDSLKMSVPEELQNTEKNVKLVSPIITMGEGYSENFYYERNEEYSCVRIYDGTVLVNEVDNITDIMITEKGVIGRDIHNLKDVYLWDIYTGEKKLFYQASENENKLWVYNTYDKKGVYGLLQESDSSYTVSRINWEGTLEKLFVIEEVEMVSDVNMSVIGDWIYYCNQVSGKMERRNVMNLSEVEVIQ